MPATFWTGSNLSFTNGSKTVTVNTGSPLSSIRPNSSLTTSNYNEPVEVESAVGNIITLYSPWPGSTGDFAATITPSAATVAAAGQAAQEVAQEIKALVGGASVNVTANSFVKRDNSGRVKTATPSANEDAVNKGYLGTAATKNVTASNGIGNEDGQLLKVRDYGIGGRAFFVNNFPNSMLDAVLGGFYYGYSGAHPSATPDSNPFPDKGGAFSAIGFGNNFGGRAYSAQIAVENSNILDIKAWSIGAAANGPSGWKRLYHSGNTNFNKFGGVGSDERVATGVAINSTAVRFYLPINSVSAPTSISIVGTFSVVRDGIQTFASGVTPALHSSSSNRYAVVDVAGLSGLTAGQPVQLSTDTSSSAITVNF